MREERRKSQLKGDFFSSSLGDRKHYIYLSKREGKEELKRIYICKAERWSKVEIIVKGEIRGKGRCQP